MRSDEVADHVEKTVNQRMRLQFDAEKMADELWENFDWVKAIQDPDRYVRTFFAQAGTAILRRFGDRAYTIGEGFAEGLD